MENKDLSFLSNREYKLKGELPQENEIKYHNINEKKIVIEFTKEELDILEDALVDYRENLLWSGDDFKKEKELLNKIRSINNGK